jgi:hypothetical protein
MYFPSACIQVRNARGPFRIGILIQIFTLDFPTESGTKNENPRKRSGFRIIGSKHFFESRAVISGVVAHRSFEGCEVRSAKCETVNPSSLVGQKREMNHKKDGYLKANSGSKGETTCSFVTEKLSVGRWNVWVGCAAGHS